MTHLPSPTHHDVIVIGGGQTALAVGYYLRRTGLSFVLLDDQEQPGGAWPHGWNSLRLFSPAQWSSLPGWLMPRGNDEYPSRDAVVAYLAAYEQRYALPIERPVRAIAVHRHGGLLLVETSRGDLLARAVVSATGTWSSPVLPELPGADAFRGRQLHSAHYRFPGDFVGQRVIVVGAGNSAAQIVADLAESSHVTWATLAPPTYLPDEIDGRYLFEQESLRYAAIREGRAPPPQQSVGDIVMVEPVRRARDRGLLVPVPMFTAITADGARWPDGRESSADAIIWCTGFRPSLAHLAPLDLGARIAVAGTRSLAQPRLWLVGYGDWTGFASATLIGVGRTARATVAEIGEALRG